MDFNQLHQVQYENGITWITEQICSVLQAIPDINIYIDLASTELTYAKGIRQHCFNKYLVNYKTGKSLSVTH